MKKIVLVLLCGVISLSARAAEKPCIWDAGHLKTVKNSLAEEPYAEAYAALTARADQALKADNPSVMTKPAAPVSGDMHDYMSLARYYWPNPATPDGLPYVSRDGESNPELYLYDRDRLGKLSDMVCALSVKFYLSGERKYADKALSMLDTWFVDPATRMNPNLDYAQVSRGLLGDKGRPAGVIDTYSFIPMLDAVALLDVKGAVGKGRMAACKAWFGQLVDWMVTAPNGIAEDNARNNHSIAYDAQLARFAIFASRTDVAHKVIEQFPSRRLAVQVHTDGSQPDELRRTLALHYSVYNIEHMLDICDMARGLGIEMYGAADGAIDRSLRYLIPFLGDRAAFEAKGYRQISGWEGAVNNTARSILRASEYANSDEYKALYEKYRAPREDYLFTLLYL